MLKDSSFQRLLSKLHSYETCPKENDTINHYLLYVLLENINISEVDFSKYTLEDIDVTLEIITDLVMEDNEDGETFTANRLNPIMTYSDRVSIISNVKNYKHKKYSPVQEDVFL